MGTLKNSLLKIVHPEKAAKIKRLDTINNIMEMESSAFISYIIEHFKKRQIVFEEINNDPSPEGITFYQATDPDENKRILVIDVNDTAENDLFKYANDLKSQYKADKATIIKQHAFKTVTYADQNYHFIEHFDYNAVSRWML